jgi:hypothetical protein
VQIPLSAYTGKRRKATGENLPGGTKAVQISGIWRKRLDYKEILGSSGRTRIIKQTYFQQHAGQRMTPKTVKSSRNPINRAHLERVFASSVL